MQWNLSHPADSRSTGSKWHPLQGKQPNKGGKTDWKCSNLVTLADQLLQLLASLSDLIFHHGPRHAAVCHASRPDMLSPFTEVEVLLSNSGNLLLVLPHQVGDVAHRHRQEGPGGHGTERERRGSAQEDTTVAGHDRTGHGRDDDIGAAGEETLARLRRRGQRGDGVGESVLDVQGPGQEVVEAVLGGEGVFVEEKTGVSDLSSQDVCGSRGRGGEWR